MLGSTMPLAPLPLDPEQRPSDPRFTLGQRDPQTCRPFTPAPWWGEGRRGSLCQLRPPGGGHAAQDPLSGGASFQPQPGAPVGPPNPITCKAQLRARPSLFLHGGSCAQTQARRDKPRSGGLTGTPST